MIFRASPYLFFNPSFIFVCIWLFQVIGYLFFRDSFGAYSVITWKAVALGCIFFVIGGCFSKWIGGGKKELLSGWECEFPVRKFFAVLYVVYLAISIVSLIAIFKYLLIEPGTLESLKSIRDAINFDFSHNRYIFNYFRIFHFGVALSLFALTFASSFSKWEFWTIFLLGALSALATTGRLFLLLYFVACAAILFKRKKIKVRGLLSLLGSFVILFFVIAIAQKKGIGQQSTLELLIWNVQVYLFSPLAALNSAIVSNAPHFEGGALIPNAIKVILNKFGFSLDMRPTLMPFVEVPVRTNVYTSLFPLYHDGKLLGVGLGAAILGFLHGAIYRRFRSSESNIVLYVFAISLYPLVLTFFEDAYFSSPGVWVVLLSPILIFFMAHKILSRKVKGKET